MVIGARRTIVAGAGRPVRREENCQVNGSASEVQGGRPWSQFYNPYETFSLSAPAFGHKERKRKRELMKVLSSLLSESSMPTLISLFLFESWRTSWVWCHSQFARTVTEVLRMKCQHLRWVSHTLRPLQKVFRIELEQRMLQELQKHEHTKFHFLFACDESWMFDAYDHRTMWMASWGGC
jgi:hypothetical protein